MHSLSTWRARFALAFAAALVAFAVHAAAPQQKTQAPGWYRMMLGDFEVTVLSDGTLPLPVDQLLTNTTPSQMQEALGRAFQTPPVETSVNAFLVNTGSKLVLVDAGAGPLFGPTLGKVLANLKAAGYQPEQVDDIVITHLHADHVGGLMVGDQRAFANAVVHADKRDADFWLSSANLDKASAEMKDFFKGAMVSVNPYVQAGRFHAFDGDTEIVPGVRARAARGHTPGHSVYVIESKGQKLVLWGDLMHVAAVQFPDPAVTIRFDVDPTAAMAERKRAFDEAAKQGYWVGAAHLAFPGLGHLRADGAGYAFVPVSYAVPR